MEKIKIDFIWLGQNKYKVKIDNENNVEIESKELNIKFDYPLKEPVIMNFKAPNGQNFTKKNIIDCIFSGYKKIYSDIEKYKIHSHYLNQLFIEGIEYTKNSNVILLEIGS